MDSEDGVIRAKAFSTGDEMLCLIFLFVGFFLTHHKQEVMEVKNVLEQLYNGEIFPAEQYAPKGEEYRKIHQGHYHHYEDFIEVWLSWSRPLTSGSLKSWTNSLT